MIVDGIWWSIMFCRPSVLSNNFGLSCVVLQPALCQTSLYFFLDIWSVCFIVLLDLSRWLLAYIWLDVDVNECCAMVLYCPEVVAWFGLCGLIAKQEYRMWLFMLTYLYMQPVIGS